MIADMVISHRVSLAPTGGQQCGTGAKLLHRPLFTLFIVTPPLPPSPSPAKVSWKKGKI